MGNKGMGVMLGMLGGNEETVNAVQSSLNKDISHVLLNDEYNRLEIHFKDSTVLSLFDDGQSCCEDRYMATSDDLTDYDNSKLLNIELKEAPNEENEWGEHEIQFLEVTTSKGVFQCANHNVHNGYYGGFWIVAQLN